MSEGIAASSADDIVVLPWNNAGALRGALERHQGNIAAVITEPVMCNTNCIVPRSGYLEEVRRLCDQHGVVLIFDEVITGFRLALGGAQELLGVTPDLSTFAKAMAGGFPISMLAGRRDMMSLIGDGSVMHGGTVNSNVMSISAALAALTKLQEDDGAAIRGLYSTGLALMKGLRDLASKHELHILIQGPGPVFSVTFTDAPEICDYRSHKASADEETYGKFCRGMRDRGVRLIGRGAWFVSTVHTGSDIDRTLAAADETLSSL